VSETYSRRTKGQRQIFLVLSTAMFGVCSSFLTNQPSVSPNFCTVQKFLHGTRTPQKSTLPSPSSEYQSIMESNVRVGYYVSYLLFFFFSLCPLDNLVDEHALLQIEKAENKPVCSQSFIGPFSCSLLTFICSHIV
jgi:hypothetical protein